MIRRGSGQDTDKVPTPSGNLRISCEDNCNILVLGHLAARGNGNTSTRTQVES